MPVTRGIQAQMRAEFEEWYDRSVAAGGLDSTKERAAYWPEFCVERLGLAGSKHKSCGDNEDRKEKREVAAATLRAKEGREKCLRDYGKSMSVVDGRDAGALRQWLKHVSRAGDLAVATGEEISRFALNSCSGMLQDMVYKSFKENRQRPWAEVEVLVTNALLSANEKGFLRDEVSSLRQQWGETEAAYCQRFQIAAERGWDLQEAKPGSDSAAILMKTFIESLRNESVVGAVDFAAPDTLEEAIEVAISKGRAVRRREKMAAEREGEVQAALLEKEEARPQQRPAPVVPAVAPDNNTVKTMQGEIKALRKLVDKLTTAKQAEEAQPQHVAAAQPTTEPPRRQRAGPAPRYEQRPPIRCWRCGGPHIQRNCREGGPPQNSGWDQPRGGYGVQNQPYRRQQKAWDQNQGPAQYRGQGGEQGPPPRGGRAPHADMSGN